MEASEAPKFGIAFDIDGVLVKSGSAIEEAKDAMKKLIELRVPFVFITNSGGTPEDEKVEMLKRVLGVNGIDHRQMLCAHSPFKSLAAKYSQDRILFVNYDRQMAMKIASTYGFENCLFLEDYAASRPNLCPWKKYDDPPNNPRLFDSEPIKAIFILHEPRDWAEGLQILVDILRSDGLITNDGLNEVEEQVVELHAANPDFTYAANYNNGRFTNGAFVTCLDALYHRATGRHLKYTFYGKPLENLYLLAEQRFEELYGGPFKTFYMIGDNPHSDIKGANAMPKWSSILVRTGIFQGGSNHEEFPADKVCNHVGEAVQFVLEREKVVCM